MTNEEKILELLAQMQGDLSSLKTEQALMRDEQTRMRDDLASLKTEQGLMRDEQTRMRDDLASLKTEQSLMRDEQTRMRDDLASLKTEQSHIRDDLTRVKLRLELDVEKRFDAVNEGLDTILETMVSKNRVAELEDDVAVLKTAVKMLAKDVSELKRAQ